MAKAQTTVDWGLLPYREALERQLQQVEDRLADMVGDSLILVEHPPVITLGRRIGAEQNILWSEAECEKRGIEIVPITRGGDVTCHEPGQLVAYPIVNLDENRDLHAWLRLLEEVVIATVAQFGLRADRVQGKTGIWIENRKIAAIGVAVRRWTTFHGLALNVNNDLSTFAGVIPCGLAHDPVTTMSQELGHICPMESVREALTVEFWRKFNDTHRL